MITIRKTKGGLAFSVYVQPRSSDKAIVGYHQNALKIKLTAPPVGGAANKQCIEVLAKALAIPKSAITIISGQSSRLKQILIQPIRGDLDSSGINALKKRLASLAPGPKLKRA